MKNNLITLYLVLISLHLFSQNIKVEEPEFSGNILYVQDTTGIKLEQQTASGSTKSNAAAFVPGVGLFAGKVKSKNYVQGISSPVQIKAYSSIFRLTS